MPAPKVQILDNVPPARELQPGETRLLVLRHPEHQHNIPPQEALERLRQQGRDLAAQGYVPDAVISSPAYRASEAGFAHVCGVHDFQGDDASNLPYCHTERTIADFAFFADAALRARIKGYKKASDLPGDDALWEYLGKDDEFRDHIRERGLRATYGMQVHAVHYQHQTVLVPSHGVSVIETMLAHLRIPEDGKPGDEQLTDPPVKLIRCQIVEVILDRNGVTVEENYFPAP